jgi:hypothetical protein
LSLQKLFKFNQNSAPILDDLLTKKCGYLPRRTYMIIKKIERAKVSKHETKVHFYKKYYNSKYLMNNHYFILNLIGLYGIGPKTSFFPLCIIKLIPEGYFLP